MNGKNVLILGGTGTLGRALVEKIVLCYPETNITVLSRDEHKQAEMRRSWPRVRFVLGDIRDPSSLDRHFIGQHVVFHVAALKHVDILEENVGQCIETNVQGTINAAELASVCGVEHFIFSSTDKAIEPLNAYGMSKALAEKFLFSMNYEPTNKTKFSVYRWGNVLGSQGSVIPIFAKTLKATKTAYVTDERMTRFWLPIEWAVIYMLKSFEHAHTDQAMICPNMKSATIGDIISATAEVVGVREYTMKTIGLRPGEKIHENMIPMEFGGMTSDAAEKYTHAQLVEMIRPIVGEA